MNYPNHYPKPEGFDPESPDLKNWRISWEGPVSATNRQLAADLEESAKSLESEHGLCHRSFCMREAAHRLKSQLDDNPPILLPLRWRKRSATCRSDAADAFRWAADELESECRKTRNQADECRRILQGDLPAHKQLDAIQQILNG